MASLNTLRTKGGVIVSIVIGISLIAFLLGDLTSANGIFGNRKMNVGEIAGTTIDYTEYMQESEYTLRISQLMSGTESLSAEQSEQAREMAWESLILKHSYLPGFNEMGLSVGEAEMKDLVFGVYISPVMAQTFMNRSTGQFDPEMQRQFVTGIDADPSGNASMMWDYLKEQATNQRVMSKYMTLVMRGLGVSESDVQQAVTEANTSVSGRYISQSYTTVPDSLVNVTDSQIREYYKQHTASFRQGESRGIEYVVFDMLPSDADFAQAATRIAEMTAEFELADDPMQYAQANSQQNPDPRYLSPAAMDASLAALVNGSQKMVGPTLRGDTYTLSRLASTRMLPDTLGAKHILLQPMDVALADSLVAVLRKGSDFATLANQFSLDRNAPGGDLGRFTPDQMIPEFSDACIKASRGDVFTINTQFGLHVVSLTYKTAPVLKAQIATVTYVVNPSPATEQAIYGKASAFEAAAAGSTEKFRAAVTNEGLASRVARIRNTERNIQGLENSRALVQWAYTAKKGATSAIITIGSDYVIANLNEVRHQGFATVQEVASDIRMLLVRQAKAKMIGEKMASAGATLDLAASALGVEVTTAEDLQANAFYLEGAGVEMKLIGAMTGTRTTGKLSKPVDGTTGVFLFDITAVNTLDNATPESEKVRLETMAQSYIGERVNQALVEESKISDTRAKFF